MKRVIVIRLAGFVFGRSSGFYSFLEDIVPNLCLEDNWFVE